MRSRSLLSALLLLLLSACSTLRSPPPMPPPPANLAGPCEALSAPPTPLLDPERMVWELETVSRYQDCATRHRLTIEAWRASTRR